MFNKISKLFGPGFISGAAEDDPSAIGTYAQTGALFGFSQLWLASFSLPLLIAVQEMCGRIALSTGNGLTTVLLQHYSRTKVLGAILLLLLANIFNMAADLAAMASAANLLINIPFMILVIFFACLSVTLIIFVPYRIYEKYLSFLALTLFSYIATAFFIDIDWKLVFLSTCVPSITFSKEYFLNIIAFLGATLSPYLFFWQATQEVEEHKKIDYENHHGKHNDFRNIKDNRFDTGIGCFFSTLASWFIIITTGSVLFNKQSTIKTAADAALALKPLAGDWAFFLFALGIIATGLLALPLLAASAAFALSEISNITMGLDYTFKQAKKFYVILIIIMAVAFVFTLLPISPMMLLYYAAAFNGVCAGPILFMILGVANSKVIMGKNSNGPFSNIFSYMALLSILSCSLMFFFSFFL